MCSLLQTVVTAGELDGHISCFSLNQVSSFTVKLQKHSHFSDVTFGCEDGRVINVLETMSDNIFKVKRDEYVTWLGLKKKAPG